MLKDKVYYHISVKPIKAPRQSSCEHTMKYEIINRVFKGRLNRHINLQHLHSMVPNSTLQQTNPMQLICRDGEATILIFSKGGIRVMGKIDQFAAYAKLEKITQHISPSIPTLAIQTMSAVGQLDSQVNIKHFHNHIPCTFEFELFSALRVKKYDPMCVNVFSTGKVVIHGFIDETIVHTIMTDLNAIKI